MPPEDVNRILAHARCVIDNGLGKDRLDQISVRNGYRVYCTKFWFTPLMPSRTYNGRTSLSQGLDTEVCSVEESISLYAHFLGVLDRPQIH